ncbi:histidinol-phosphate aminotransferase 1 [Candidatus Vecturithrix granuli]|uniref:Histidinol-phosphate aminotransferase 1 n=1 Tax=Vecturithrix granuli TaxID=1499967 RepID=A0A081C3D2_VECG1|nr:histidinol-phosphate aminotransferase 1 [Candidatus Vecturithrix granuli]
MKQIQEYFVPWIKGIPMYISSHLELAWREPQLHRMMSNENPHEPSPKVYEAIVKYAKMANRYPDQGLVVRGKIAEINGLDGPGNVMIGNGSSEVFDMLFRCFLEPGQEVIQHTPCFGIYKLRCQILGGKLVSVPMIYKDKQLLFDADAVLKAVTEKTKIIVIANPNNPTGNFMDADSFIKIAETGIPFVIDEAYVEYAGLEMSQVQLTKKYKNVMITRTLSKAYGLAGMRFGYALADKDLIAQVSATLIPWNVGTIPMWAALAALEDTESLEKRREFNNSEIKFIENALSNIPGLTIFRSYGNYMLFDGTDAGKVGDEMIAYAQKKKGLILRPQAPMYGRNGFFRITIGTKEENRMLVEAVKEFFAQ